MAATNVVLSFCYLISILFIDCGAFERELRTEIPLRSSSSRVVRTFQPTVIDIVSNTTKFQVKVYPAGNLLSSTFRLYENNGSVVEHAVDSDILREHYLEGEVVNEPESRAVLYLNGDFLSGNLFLIDEVYTIDEAFIHKVPNTDSEKHFLARTKVIYREPIKRDRHRRFHTLYDLQQPGIDFAPGKKKCSLRLLADYHYFHTIGEGNLRRTVDQMITHIQRVNVIFNQTQFSVNAENDGYFNMGFVVQDVVVFTSPTKTDDGSKHFNMEGNISADEMLSSLARHEAPNNKFFCLAHLLTARNLGEGQLGISYMAKVGEQLGICARPVFDNTTNSYVVRNVGLSTSLLMNSRLLSRISDIALAHELAHGWGASHDPDTEECSPSNKNGGSYIMHTYARHAVNRNSRLFSPCSIRQLAIILKDKVKECFVEGTLGGCGNFIVDEDEDCDVGPLNTNDTCCDRSCRFRKGAVCSDMNHACCNNCSFAVEGTLCRSKLPGECLADAFCSGQTERCPQQKSLPNNTSCLDRGQCIDGTCMPFCQTIGQLPCLCDGDQACYRCCKTAENEPCRQIEPLDRLIDGTFCNDGFCKQGKCTKRIQDFITSIVDIIQRVSAPWLLRNLEKHWATIMILGMSVVWFPVGVCLHCYDKKRYSFSSEPARNSSLITKSLSFNYLNARASYGYLGERDFERRKDGVKHTTL